MSVVLFEVRLANRSSSNRTLIALLPCWNAKPLASKSIV